jgi:hypothetical protein
LASGPINPSTGAAPYALQALDEKPQGAADARRVAGAPASTPRVPRHGALGCGRLVYLHTLLHLQNAITAQGRCITEGLAARDACTRGSPCGGTAAMARLGAAGRRPHAPSPASDNPQHEGRVTAQAPFPPAARPGTARRRQGPDSPAWPAPLQPLAKAMDHGPGSALGCAGSATVFPLNPPERRHCQHNKPGTRRARAPRLVGAVRHGCELLNSPARQPKASALTGSSGAHGLGLPRPWTLPAEHGATSSLGRRRRGAPRHWRLDGTPSGSVNTRTARGE